MNAEKWHHFEISIAINDESQGSIAKNLRCDELLYYTFVGSWSARSPVCPLKLAYNIPRFFPFAKTVCVSVRKNSVDVSEDKK